MPARLEPAEVINVLYCPDVQVYLPINFQSSTRPRSNRENCEPTDPIRNT